ncbi:GIY-YIG nuclease family protein [Streptomyces sp. TLI_185]|uniref:GIY-YIG nuclease family protein n=1 Tax=Streptomyces sp. TLI_185 TaxID=2485151 RepID=UPI000F50A450|nr:GIY-YIG nuclease family protein [Streptomyces sp. TLI_185]RPF37608.1 T5orf172 domain-containing protein [Streptomyces sp. TLI_185]
MPLSPAACLELLLDHAGDQPLTRGEIIGLLEKVHAARGGAFKEAGHLVGAVKKALSVGKRTGVLANPRQGYYMRVSETAAPDASQEDYLGPPADGFGAAVGTGQGSVYVWYLPAYRERARASGAAIWERKIGMSAYSAARRVAEQGYMPEKPVCALLVRTDHERDLERYVHSTLDGRGRRVEAAVGTEWFFTNPGEVLSIARETRWIAKRQLSQ